VRERARGASRRLAWVGAAAVAAGAAVVAVRAESGCATHQCDADCVVRGAASYSGCPGGDKDPSATFGNAYRVGDAIVWESSEFIGESWLHFPGQRRYELHWANAVSTNLHIEPCVLASDYEVLNVEPYVSTFEDAATDNFVPAAGQLAEITYLSSEYAQVNITNGSCAEYYLRVVVELVPKHEGGVPDGGACDAGLSEASDAPTDASTDAADATEDAPRAD
jgi:hypothetical protein